jgi:hypothetical protein
MAPLHRVDEIRSGEQEVLDLGGLQEDEAIKIQSR